MKHSPGVNTEEPGYSQILVMEIRANQERFNRHLDNFEKHVEDDSKFQKESTKMHTEVLLGIKDLQNKVEAVAKDAREGKEAAQKTNGKVAEVEEDLQTFKGKITKAVDDLVGFIAELKDRRKEEGNRKRSFWDNVKLSLLVFVLTSVSGFVATALWAYLMS